METPRLGVLAPWRDTPFPVLDLMILIFGGLATLGATPFAAKHADGGSDGEVAADDTDGADNAD